MSNNKLQVEKEPIIHVQESLMSHLKLALQANIRYY